TRATPETTSRPVLPDATRWWATFPPRSPRPASQVSAGSRVSCVHAGAATKGTPATRTSTPVTVAPRELHRAARRTTASTTSPPSSSSSAAGLRLPVAHGLARASVNLAPASARRYQATRSEEHTSELQSRENLVCRLL